MKKTLNFICKWYPSCKSLVMLCLFLTLSFNLCNQMAVKGLVATWRLADHEEIDEFKKQFMCFKKHFDHGPCSRCYIHHKAQRVGHVSKFCHQFDVGSDIDHTISATKDDPLLEGMLFV